MLCWKNEERLNKRKTDNSFHLSLTSQTFSPFSKKVTLLSSLWPPTDSNSLFSPDCPFTIESFLSQRNLNLDEAFGKVDAMPGAERLVQHLYKHNVPICVATGSKLRNFKIKSKPHDGIFKPFGQRIICGDDERINRGKPFPDIFLLAAREGLGLEELKDQVREMGEEFDGTLKGREGDILVFEDGLRECLL